jgi:serine protease Do
MLRTPSVKRFGPTARVARTVLTILCLLAIGGCAAPERDASGGPAFDISSLGQLDIFSDQSDKLKALVDAKKYDEAAEYYAKEKSYFDDKKRRSADQLRGLADALNLSKAALLAAANRALEEIHWPAPEADWLAIREAIATASKTDDSYRAYVLLQDPGLQAPAAKRLHARLKTLNDVIRADARGQFAAYDLFADVSFFDTYPVTLEKRSLMDGSFADLRPRLAAVGPEQVEKFANTYGKDVFADAAWHQLGTLYVEALLRQAGAKGAPSLRAVLAATRKASKHGLVPDRLPAIKVGVIEATSPTLLKEGQIEFPAQIDVDLPIAVEKTDLDKVLSGVTAKAADYLIVFDVALAKVRRKITDIAKLPSRMVVGHKTVPNPDYGAAQATLTQAQIEFQKAAMDNASANAQYCYGLGCIGKLIGQIATGVAEGKARDKVDAAMATMRSTPMTLDQPIYQDYKYDKASIHAQKLMTVHYYVLDLQAKAYFKSTFDVREQKTFSVMYDVRDSDPEHAAHIAEGQRDQDVVAWEEAPSSLKLSQLVDHYLAEAKESKSLPSLATLRSEILADKNRALRHYAAKAVEDRPKNDTRFDSVVVVIPTGKDMLGAGFFVTPDVVLTNFHVVEDATFVDLKLFDKQETFGKVIARDAQVDLALIKVQSRGKPVRFYDGKKLDLGQTVEAIGHPHGLEFSITRGVISAIRRHETLNLPGSKGELTTFIQTDASINPGNSGGPLFLGDKVIGVNDFMVAKSISEGLGFAIHYQEVLDFLRENLPGFAPEHES